MKLATIIGSARKSSLSVFIIVLTVSTFGRDVKVVTAPPVFWNVFNADVIKDKVTLKWVVTEYNNKGFYIQHSLDGSDWKTIDSITSKDSPLTLDEYTYTHVNKLSGRQYYRVKQVDIDLTRTGYSGVITLVLRPGAQDNAEAPGITISPNPATDQVKITAANGISNYYKKAMIFDLSGKMVAEKTFDSHTTSINIKELPAGIYIMRAESNEGTWSTQKIIKQ